MNKAKDGIQQRMSPNPFLLGAFASHRERRAVVELYEGPQMMPDEAMLPMPPHNMARSPGHLLQDTQQWLGRWQILLRLLKRRI